MGGSQMHSCKVENSWQGSTTAGEASGPPVNDELTVSQQYDAAEKTFLPQWFYWPISQTNEILGNINVIFWSAQHW